MTTYGMPCRDRGERGFYLDLCVLLCCMTMATLIRPPIKAGASDTCFRNSNSEPHHKSFYNLTTPSLPPSPTGKNALVGPQDVVLIGLASTRAPIVMCDAFGALHVYNVCLHVLWRSMTHLCVSP